MSFHITPVSGRSTAAKGDIETVAHYNWHRDERCILPSRNRDAAPSHAGTTKTWTNTTS